MTHSALTKAKVRDAMLNQQLITGIEDKKCRELLLNDDTSSLTWEKACSLVRHKATLKSQSHGFNERSTSSTPIVHQVQPTLTHARSNSSPVGGACLR